MSNIKGRYDRDYSYNVLKKFKNRNPEWMFVEKLIVEGNENLHKNPKRQRLYIANHLSHADYCMAWVLFHRENIKMPMIPAGSNLDIPVLRWLGVDFGKMGGFFIDRDLICTNGRNARSHKKDLIGTIRRILEEKESLLVFPEGGRSYGEQSFPRFKTGITDIVIKQEPDIDIVNMAFDYDKRVEEGFFDYLQHFRKKKVEAKAKGKNLLGSIYESAYIAVDMSAFVKRITERSFGVRSGNAYVKIDSPKPLAELTAGCQTLEEKSNALRDYSISGISRMRVKK
jgi:glycerol-3-phosphate O-acyltransferase